LALDTNVAIGVGVAAGVLVIGSVVLLLVLLIVRKRRRKQKTVTTEPSTKNETQPTSPQNIPPSQNTPQSTKDQIDQLSKEKSKQTITTHSSSRKKNVGGLDIGQGFCLLFSQNFLAHKDRNEFFFLSLSLFSNLQVF
jgi:uncharacterized membrane protein YhiD involved in acid resistance